MIHKSENNAHFVAATATKAIPWDEKIGNYPFKSKELEQYLFLFVYGVSKRWVLIYPG